jgi:hypothetical protein
MGKSVKVIYDRRSNTDRREDDKNTSTEQKSPHTEVQQNRRVLSNRRKSDGLELSTDALATGEFAEVFKQFQKEPDTKHHADNLEAEKLEIIDYQVLYRKGVECAYITILKTNQQEEAPTLYAFREENENADSDLESAPLQVQNIFGADAYDSYIEQGWNDISKTENTFPWALKAWLAQNMKQDEIKSR